MATRMHDPGTLVPGAMEAFQALSGATFGPTAPAPAGVLALVHLRTSQVNGCSVCVGMAMRDLRKAGDSDERILAVSAWRHSPRFTDAERAALALAEAMTRMSDRPDPVPDGVWEEARSHFDEAEMASIVLAVALSNAFNRVNVATGQIAGSWGG